MYSLFFIEMIEIIVDRYCNMDVHFDKRKIDILTFSL